MTPMVEASLPRVWVSFDLVGGSFDPATITTELRIAPTDEHRAGEEMRPGVGRWPRDRWRVTVGPVSTVEIDGMLGELVALLEPGEPHIRSVCQRFGLSAVLTCTVEPTSSLTPNVTFPPTIIAWAAAHDVAIAVDLMIWSDDETS
jgi:hypothetical protein